MRVSFTEHPASVGESYVEHLRVASSFGGAMLLGGVACLLHGLLPFLFTRTGSTTVARLYQRMVTNRTAKPDAAPGQTVTG
ncbi:MAG: hypothetical protein KGL12_11570 [Rhodospirillales bacterium]|nr:hypothetical protein [Rhodospirillales bacterium]